MSDDLAQALLCLSFTLPAAGLLAVVLMRRNLRGGSDVESSAALFEDEEVATEKLTLSAGVRRAIAISIWFCLTLITLVTVVTLFVANRGTVAAGQCPLGF